MTNRQGPCTATLAVLGALLTACATPGTEDAGDSPTAPASSPAPSRSVAPSLTDPTGSTEPSGTPTRRSPSSRDRCAQVRHELTVTYTIRTQPTATGRDLWLDLTLDNRMDRPFYGATGGVLVVDPPAPGRPAAIKWGASSADFVEVPALGRSTRGIYDYIGEPLQVTDDARVRLVGVYTVLTNTRPGCRLPAEMRAPFGLVTHHPYGSWFLTAREGERLQRVGFGLALKLEG